MLGVTFSPLDELVRFKAEIGLGCDLLCDADRSVAIDYGAADSTSQAKAGRVTVVIDASGQVAHVYAPEDVAGHAEEVLADLTM